MTDIIQNRGDPYDISLADSLKGVVLPKDWKQLFSDSNCSALFPPVAMAIIQHETAMYQKIGIPNGWSEPLTPKMNFFFDFIVNYLRNTPSIKFGHLDRVLAGIGEASKRPPKIDLGVPQSLDRELDEIPIPYYDKE